jgi:hypothetical protein
VDFIAFSGKEFWDRGDRKVGGSSTFHISKENICFLIVTFKPPAWEIKKAKQNSVSPSLIREYSISQ